MIISLYFISQDELLRLASVTDYSSSLRDAIRKALQAVLSEVVCFYCLRHDLYLKSVSILLTNILYSPLGRAYRETGNQVNDTKQAKYHPLVHV